MQTPNARSRLISLGRMAIIAAAFLVACDDHDVVGPAGPGANASHQAPYAGPSRFSLTFDGVSSVANTADDALATTETDDIQLEASFNWAGNTSAGAQVILYNGNLFASGWGIFMDQATGHIAVGGAALSYLVTDLAVTPGQWHRVIARRDAGVMTVTLDGASFDAARVAVGTLSNPAILQCTMVGGASSTCSPFTAPTAVFNGAIDDVRFTTLTGEIVEAWDFEEGTGNSAVGAHGTRLALSNTAWTNANGPGVRADIVVNPRQPDQPVDPEDGGEISVAVLSTDAFDPATINPSTVRFGPGSARPRHAGARVDVNGDRRKDLVFEFDLRRTGVTCLDSTATLTALTRSHSTVAGSAVIQTLFHRLPADRHIVRCESPRIIARELLRDSLNSNGHPLLNDRGEMAGSYLTPTGRGVFRWHDGVQSMPAALAGGSVEGLGEGGHVVGRDGSNAAFMWNGDAISTFAPATSEFSLEGINPGGEIYGVAYDGSTGRPDWVYTWRDGVTRQLPLPEGLYSDFPTNVSNGMGISDSGAIGYIFYMADLRAVPFVWNGLTWKQLPLPATVDQFDFPRLAKLNRLGVSAVSYRAVAGGRISLLGTTDGMQSIGQPDLTPVKLSDRNQVVFQGDFPGLSYLWDGETLRQLPLPAGASAVDLNDRGEVLALASGTPMLVDSRNRLVPLSDGRFRPGDVHLTDINDIGQAAGIFRRPGATRYTVVLWEIDWRDGSHGRGDDHGRGRGRGRDLERHNR